MNWTLVCQGATLMVAAIACAISWRTYRRQALWKNSEEAKKFAAEVQKAVAVGESLVTRVSQAEAVGVKLNERLEDSRRLDLEAETKQKLLELRIATLQRDLDGMPTRDEVTRLEGKVDRGFEKLEGAVKLEAALMTRVESTLARVEEGLRAGR